jgi:hypothetical protein
MSIVTSTATASIPRVVATASKVAAFLTYYLPSVRGARVILLPKGTAEFRGVLLRGSHLVSVTVVCAFVSIALRLVNRTALLAGISRREKSHQGRQDCFDHCD